MKSSAFLTFMVMLVWSVADARAMQDSETGITLLASGIVHSALYAIDAADDEVVAVGTAGRVVRSQDGGRTWAGNAVAGLESIALLDVALSNGAAIGVGQLGKVVLRDGADTWRIMSSGSERRLLTVSLAADGTAVAGGEFGTLLTSNDGGRNWTPVSPDWGSFNLELGIEPHVYDTHIADSGEITVVGELGLILQSRDGGRTWVERHRGDASLLALDMREDGTGYAVGQAGTVLKTEDAGGTWVLAARLDNVILLGVHSTVDGRVLATGMRGMFESNDDGRSWRRITAGDVQTEWYQGVTVIDGATALAVGHAARIIRVGN